MKYKNGVFVVAVFFLFSTCSIIFAQEVKDTAGKFNPNANVIADNLKVQDHYPVLVSDGILKWKCKLSKAGYELNHDDQIEIIEKKIIAKNKVWLRIKYINKDTSKIETGWIYNGEKGRQSNVERIVSGHDKQGFNGFNNELSILSTCLGWIIPVKNVYAQEPEPEPESETDVIVETPHDSSGITGGFPIEGIDGAAETSADTIPLPPVEMKAEDLPEAPNFQISAMILALVIIVEVFVVFKYFPIKNEYIKSFTATFLAIITLIILGVLSEESIFLLIHNMKP